MTPLCLLGVFMMLTGLIGVPAIFYLWKNSGNWFDLRSFYCFSGGFAALGIVGLIAFCLGLLIKR
jgi:hypothetical protein